jgi:hypothetical protein
VSLGGNERQRFCPEQERRGVKRDWSADELIENWTLLPGEKQWLANKTGPTRAKFRDCVSVQNERLGVVLESLERAGQLRRTPAGWQRVD